MPNGGVMDEQKDPQEMDFTFESRGAMEAFTPSAQDARSTTSSRPTTP